ncbi:multicomponent Na+:H+ antiporter subunit E [Parapedobacter composti]|uniref:Multicomponent Na+:H+ antiporter subunit E n=1 Tax=Parapedobacter composti TaxID=623281 RepID=A0A1I1F068_9SPHI|nr:Na+/H+ antiporter subunit E [Parapedobacter composti]SFB92386.1 multicomponent Na+:H+ antiporter subunit E [Parapedobacter composti]
MAKQFLMNLLLAFIWVALTGALYYSNFLFGFGVGFFLMWVMNRGGTDDRYFTRVPKVIGFFLYFVYEMVKANIQVAYDVITPKYFMKPGIVKYPMNAKTDFEINMLSTVISLTPGTLIIDVSEDRKVLYIHVMYLRDKEQFIRQIKDGFERRLLEVIR